MMLTRGLKQNKNFLWNNIKDKLWLLSEKTFLHISQFFLERQKELDDDKVSNQKIFWNISFRKWWHWKIILSLSLSVLFSLFCNFLFLLFFCSSWFFWVLSPVRCNQIKWTKKRNGIFWFFLLLKTFSMTIAAKKKVKMCQKEKWK